MLKFGAAVLDIIEVCEESCLGLQVPVYPGKFVESDFTQIPSRMNAPGGQGMVGFVQYAVCPVSHA